MFDSVGVRELRQHLSRYLDRVKDGESLTVTEHGRVVARLVPSGEANDPYADLTADYGATVPRERLEDIAARLERPGAPAGTTDAYLQETRAPRER